MKNLTICHKAKLRYVWIVSGVILLLLGIADEYYSDEASLQFSFGMGLVFILTGFYYWLKPYVRIKNNILWVSTYPFRKVQLSEIERVKQFLDETTFIVNGEKTKVTTQQMSETDKKRFNLFLKEFNTERLHSEENQSSLSTSTS